MKFFLFLLLITSTVMAGLPPTTLSGQQATQKPTTFGFQAPNYQATQVSGVNSLIETGNSNILVNPSFENALFNAGWLNTGGTAVLETSNVIDGKRSYDLLAAGGSFEVYQDSTLYASQFTGGVQGLAMIRVKTTVAGLYVCSRSAGVTSSISNCLPVSNSGSWGLYKIPFILGGTSNGISITSNGVSVSGDVYLDNAFVGASDVKADSPIVGPWVNYGPMTITATTSNPTKPTTKQYDYVECRVAGQDYECRYVFRADSGTGGSAGSGAYVFHLPTGIEFSSDQPIATAVTQTGATSSNSQVAVPSIYAAKVGSASATVLSDAHTFNSGLAFAVSSTTFQVQILNGVSTSGYIASGYFNLAGQVAYNFTLKFKGKGLSGNISTYSANCGVNCIDVFSAKVLSTGTVDSENVDWINGNASITNTSTYAISFNSGTFTVAPACVVSPYEAVDTTTVNTVERVLVTASGVSIRTTINSGSGLAAAFRIICQKQGADFQQTRTIVGSFFEVMTSPGIARPKVCHYYWGGASSTLAAPTTCTTGTCVEVLDTCGTGTPPSVNGTGRVINMTFASGTFANNSPIRCSCTAYSSAANELEICMPYFDTGDNTWSTNSNGGYVTNVFTTAEGGASRSSYVQLECSGLAP